MSNKEQYFVYVRYDDASREIIPSSWIPNLEDPPNFDMTKAYRMHWTENVKEAIDNNHKFSGQDKMYQGRIIKISIDYEELNLCLENHENGLVEGKRTRIKKRLTSDDEEEIPRTKSALKQSEKKESLEAAKSKKNVQKKGEEKVFRQIMEDSIKSVAAKRQKNDKTVENQKKMRINSQEIQSSSASTAYDSDSDNSSDFSLANKNTELNFYKKKVKYFSVENASLHDEVKSLRVECKSLRADYSSLLRENAELRKEVYSKARESRHSEKSKSSSRSSTSSRSDYGSVKTKYSGETSGKITTAPTSWDPDCSFSAESESQNGSISWSNSGKIDDWLKKKTVRTKNRPQAHTAAIPSASVGVDMDIISKEETAESADTPGRSEDLTESTGAVFKAQSNIELADETAVDSGGPSASTENPGPSNLVASSSQGADSDELPNILAIRGESDSKEIHLGHNIWIDEKNWTTIIPNNVNPKQFVKKLSFSMYGSEIAERSLTGRVPPKYSKDPNFQAKKKFSPKKAEVIRDMFARKLNMMDLSPEEKKKHFGLLGVYVSEESNSRSRRLKGQQTAERLKMKVEKDTLAL